MNNKWSIIGTWAMSEEGIEIGEKILKNNGSSSDAVEKTIIAIENNPFYKSVRYGGLPNEEGEVELDAAFMDGKTLSLGAVAGVKGFKNPISIAKKLSEDRFNTFLVGTGAEIYASNNGFKKENLLTDISKNLWENKKKEMYEEKLSSYDGHDTVCVIALDNYDNMTVGTSTSGLFMKKRGRVGDSPLSGSGFYVDNEIGGAAATGVGEDIMKGCLSYEVVRKMKSGISPMDAAQSTVVEFSEKLKQRRGTTGAISIIALNNNGEWGIGTNVEFTFVVASIDKKLDIYVATPSKDKKNVFIERALKEKLKEYKSV